MYISVTISVRSTPIYIPQMDFCPHDSSRPRPHPPGPHLSSPPAAQENKAAALRKELRDEYHNYMAQKGGNPSRAPTEAPAVQRVHRIDSIGQVSAPFMLSRAEPASNPPPLPTPSHTNTRTTHIHYTILTPPLLQLTNTI